MKPSSVYYDEIDWNSSPGFYKKLNQSARKSLLEGPVRAKKFKSLSERRQRFFPVVVGSRIVLTLLSPPSICFTCRNQSFVDGVFPSRIDLAIICQSKRLQLINLRNN